MKHAIIVAGGVGTRMKSTIPKQFLLLDGAPIIVHTIRKFLAYDAQISLVVVLPEKYLKQWKEIKDQYFDGVSIICAKGGATRSASVISGLDLIDDEGIVAVHDAVRPHISTNTIRKAFDQAEKLGSSVVVVPLKDSIRKLTDQSSIAQNRSEYVLVQTPQVFRVRDLKHAYTSIKSESYTDDASVFEAAGYSVHLVEGSYANIKITTPEDLK